MAPIHAIIIRMCVCMLAIDVLLTTMTIVECLGIKEINCNKKSNTAWKYYLFEKWGL